jgi:Zn finger protein HypA/HybF involved in hydrogenase expression
MSVRQTEIRCKTCTARFPVPSGGPLAKCPHCGQGWKLKWLDGDQPMIIAPASWRKYQQRTVERWG